MDPAQVVFQLGQQLPALAQAYALHLTDHRGIHPGQRAGGADAVGGRQFRSLCLGRVEVDLGRVGDRERPVAQ